MINGGLKQIKQGSMEYIPVLRVKDVPRELVKISTENVQNIVDHIEHKM